MRKAQALSWQIFHNLLCSTLRQYLLLLGLQQKRFTPLKRKNLNMPVRQASLKASIMSCLIMTSGPKYVPEVWTQRVTSLDWIHQHSVAIFLGQEHEPLLWALPFLTEEM